MEIISTNFREVSPVTTLVNSERRQQNEAEKDIGINEQKMSAMYVP